MLVYHHSKGYSLQRTCRLLRTQRWVMMMTTYDPAVASRRNGISLLITRHSSRSLWNRLEIPRISCWCNTKEVVTANQPSTRSASTEPREVMKKNTKGLSTRTRMTISTTALLSPPSPKATQSRHNLTAREQIRAVRYRYCGRWEPEDCLPSCCVHSYQSAKKS